jgi:Ser/Thr protein kinase RdoA (MazF antagonist)
MKPSVEAAARVGTRHGYATCEPVLVQETNNTVVWLRPHGVVAKVGTRPHSSEALTLEHAVAEAMAADGAPIAAPIPSVKPTLDSDTGFLVTFWSRLEHDPDREIAAKDWAQVLRKLHEHVAGYEGSLPSVKDKLSRARAALAKDDLMAALPMSDRSMLRAAFDHLYDSVDSYEYRQRPLHGEPHDGNLLATPSGLTWIDLEGVCVGPLEWDVAFLPEQAEPLFPDVNDGLLSTLRSLNSARVATWCWSRPEYAELRWHAEHHSEIVRQAFA